MEKRSPVRTAAPSLPIPLLPSALLYGLDIQWTFSHVPSISHVARISVYIAYSQDSESVFFIDRCVSLRAHIAKRLPGEITQT